MYSTPCPSASLKYAPRWWFPALLAGVVLCFSAAAQVPLDPESKAPNASILKWRDEQQATGFPTVSYDGIFGQSISTFRDKGLIVVVNWAWPAATGRELSAVRAAMIAAVRAAAQG